MPVAFSFAGFDPNARRVYLGHAETFAQLLEVRPATSSPFVLFIGSDAAAASTNTVSEAANALLDRGAVYVLTWGSDCNRVQQLFDDAIAVRSVDSEQPVPITTAHPDESIVVALTFAADFAAPPEEFDAREMLVVIVGSAELYRTAGDCLAALLEDEAPVGEA